MNASGQGDAGDRYDHGVEVSAGDIDTNGHANNVVYLRWIQDAAVAHWNAVVDAEAARGLSWVVVRHEIDYLKPAVRGDVLVVRTWVTTVSAATTERFCEVIRESDGQPLARSRTIWCAIDAETGRPRRISASIRAAFLGGLRRPEKSPES